MARLNVADGSVLQAYRFALDPSPAQVQSLESHCGAARFAFNHMLAFIKSNLDQRAAERSYGISDRDLTPLQGWSLPALRKTWNVRKAVAAPWWSANSKEAYNSGLDALARALDGWSKSRAGARVGAMVRFPKFKSRNRGPRSVRFTTGTIRVDDHRHVVLPRVGRMRTHESTRKLDYRLQMGTARILSATVRYSGGRWHCSFQVVVTGKRRPGHASRSNHRVVGVDVGVRDLLVAATPEGDEVLRIAAPKSLVCEQSRLRAAQRRLARRQGPFDAQTGTRRHPSKRWQRTSAQISRIHARVSAIRGEAIHRATTRLATQHDVVVIEHLWVKNMCRSGGQRKTGLNRAIADAALSRIRTQLDYKTSWYGARLVVAPRFFPSTQICSRCGAKTNLRLRDRIYCCRDGCLAIDRDLNAATNLARLGALGSPEGKRTGTGSKSAASDSAGEGRGAIRKTSHATIVVKPAEGTEASTPIADLVSGTATSQGGAA